MSDFIDVQDIAIRNRIAVDGRVNPTIEDWNNLLTHIDRLEQENVKMKEQMDTWSKLFHSENKENNRLLQENAELREAASSLLDLFDGVVFTHKTHQDRTDFLNARNNLKQLLNK